MLSKKTIWLFVIAHIYSAEAMAERYALNADWHVIVSHSEIFGVGTSLESKTPLMITAMSFDEDGASKLMYQCVHHKNRNFKRTAISLYINNFAQLENGSATITFSSGKESGNFHVSNVTNANIAIDNLYFLDLLQKSDALSVSVEIRSLIRDKYHFVSTKELLFNVEGFNATRSHVDEKCFK